MSSTVNQPVRTGGPEGLYRKSKWGQPLWWIGAWLAFVVSLSVWWLIFSLRKIQQLASFVPGTEVMKEQKMIFAEGMVLIGTLFLGGLALLYYALREQKRMEDIRRFFSSLAHDTKTTIARLVLQSEDLPEEASESFKKNLLDLERQLENSLQVAHSGARKPQMEEVDVAQIVGRLHRVWTNLQFQLQGSDKVPTDVIALESILKNLVSNSARHGLADEIFLEIKVKGREWSLLYCDNAKQALTEEALRAGRNLKSARGLGLYIIHHWVDTLNGRIDFDLSLKEGLQVKAVFPLEELA